MTPEHPSDPPTRLLALPGGQASITDVGDGPPVLAVPGLPGSVRDYRWLAACIESHVRLVRVDMPGFGETPVRMSGPDVDSQADFLIAVLDALQCPRAVVMGHSFGTPPVVRAAARRPDRVAGIALLAPIGRRPHRGFRNFRGRGVFGLATAIPVLRAAVIPLIRRAFRRAGFKRVTDAEIRRTMAILRRWSFEDHVRAIDSLSVPVFGAQCRDDPLVEPEIVEELLETCPAGPHLWFETGGHNLQKTHAVEIGEALVPWVRDVLLREPRASSGDLVQGLIS